jgi:hypothetical protein
MKIAGYFQSMMEGQRHGQRRNDIENKLPQIMPTWGKVRIAGGGDRIQAASASTKTPERDCSWVRVIIDFILSVLRFHVDIVTSMKSRSRTPAGIAVNQQQFPTFSMANLREYWFVSYLTFHFGGTNFEEQHDFWQS